MNSGPFLVTRFRFTRFPWHRGRLHDGGDSTCGLWVVGCPCSFLHHQTVLLSLHDNLHHAHNGVRTRGKKRRVQIRGHLGLAALSMRQKSTLARLRKCNLVFTGARRWLMAQGASYAAPLPGPKLLWRSRQHPGCCPSVATKPLRLKRSINCMATDEVMQDRSTRQVGPLLSD